MAKRLLFKVEKDRVLVPVGEPCPFGCKYCYTRGGEVGLSKLNPDDILYQFEQFAQDTSFDTIQFGYDGDPFARPARGVAMLQRLALLGKNLNFSTKASLDAPTLNALAAIQQRMAKDGTMLSALVSVSCWDSASSVEPHTPSPSERMGTVSHLKQIGVPAFIAVRPILPHISDSEYENIAIEGIRAECDGLSWDLCMQMIEDSSCVLYPRKHSQLFLIERMSFPGLHISQHGHATKMKSVFIVSVP